jgi:SET domain-containing protein
MMLFRTYVAMSEIQGLGVFAGEFIPKGSKIWALDPKFDLLITPNEVEALPPHMQEFVGRYGYPHMELPGIIVLDSDHGKFMNHSLTPNTDFRVFDVGYALVDIAEGEEINCNYFEFNPAFRGFAAASLPDANVSALLHAPNSP